MSGAFGRSGNQGGAYHSMVGPGYSYAVITSSSDPIDDPPERRCSRDRRHSRDHGHCHHYDHHHDHCHDHNCDHRYGRSREHTRTSADVRRSREHTLSSSSHRDSGEMSRSPRERAGTGPFGSLPSGLTLPKSTLAKSAMEMSDFEGGPGFRNRRPTTVSSRKGTMRSRGNTCNTVRRRSGSVASVSSMTAVPPMTIRKKSSNIPGARVRPRGILPTEGTVDLHNAGYRDVEHKTSKEKGRRRGSKVGGGSLWGSCFGL